MRGTMNKFQFSFRSAAIGSLGAIVPLFFYLGTVVRLENKSLTKAGCVYSIIDSEKTKDWKNPALDTMLVIPISASQLFHEDMTYLIKTGKVKITSSPR